MERNEELAAVVTSPMTPKRISERPLGARLSRTNEAGQIARAQEKNRVSPLHRVSGYRLRLSTPDEWEYGRADFFVGWTTIDRHRVPQRRARRVTQF